MALREEKYKIQKFRGRANDDYKQRKLRYETPVKGKDYWELLQKDGSQTMTKQKSSSLLTFALGDSALRV